MPVTSIQEEIEVAVAALLKFKCVGIKDGLPALLWEAVFSPPEKPEAVAKVHASTLANFMAARELALDELSRQDDLDISMALLLLKRQSVRLLEKDRTFALEMQHLSSLVDGGAQSLLQDAMLKILDDVSAASGSLEDVHKLLMEMKDDVAYIANTLSAKEDWLTVHGAVSALLRGQCPNGFDNAEEDSLLHHLAHRSRW